MCMLRLMLSLNFMNKGHMIKGSFSIVVRLETEGFIIWKAYSDSLE